MFGDEYDVSRNNTGETVSKSFDEFYETESEQNLSISMYDELCQKYGLKCMYYSRVFHDIDGVFGEDRYSLFTSEFSFPIKLYAINFTKYNPSAAFNKTQYTTNDNPKFHIVKKRFALAAKKHLGIENFEPKPGDVFLIEMTDDVWQLNFTEPEAQYYDRGKAFVWEFMCVRYNFGGEKFETGDDRLDLIKDVDNLGINPDPDKVTGDNLRVKSITSKTLIVSPENKDIYGGC